MPQRITRVTTKSGDDGRTSLAAGRRVAKTDPAVEALGAVDELNCHIGALRAAMILSSDLRLLGSLQQDLFDLGARLAGGGNDAPDASRLETLTEDGNYGLPALDEFVLPGGDPRAAQCHLARAVCRRAERRVAALHDADALVYLNRLSDLLFVLARGFALRDGSKEELWEPRRAG